MTLVNWLYKRTDPKCRVAALFLKDSELWTLFLFIIRSSLAKTFGNFESMQSCFCLVKIYIEYMEIFYFLVQSFIQYGKMRLNIGQGRPSFFIWGRGHSQIRLDVLDIGCGCVVSLYLQAVSISLLESMKIWCNIQASMYRFL